MIYWLLIDMFYWYIEYIWYSQFILHFFLFVSIFIFYCEGYNVLKKQINTIEFCEKFLFYFETETWEQNIETKNLLNYYVSSPTVCALLCDWQEITAGNLKHILKYNNRVKVCSCLWSGFILWPWVTSQDWWLRVTWHKLSCWLAADTSHRMISHLNNF